MYVAAFEADTKQIFGKGINGSDNGKTFVAFCGAFLFLQIVSPQ